MILPALAERLEGLGLRLHVNRLRGVAVLARRDDNRPVNAQQWWTGGLTEAALLALLHGPPGPLLDYLGRVWPRHITAAPLPDLPHPRPPGEEDFWSDLPDDSDEGSKP